MYRMYTLYTRLYVDQFFDDLNQFVCMTADKINKILLKFPSLALMQHAICKETSEESLADKLVPNICPQHVVKLKYKVAVSVLPSLSPPCIQYLT